MPFQSTPSAWRETLAQLSDLLRMHISIHSLRMEGDAAGVYHAWRTGKFQSTPSAWRETDQEVFGWLIWLFLSTPSAWRETISRKRSEESSKHFNPLPPHGGRRDDFTKSRYDFYISIHSLRMEGDFIVFRTISPPVSFQSTPSAWRETILRSRVSIDRTISIHSLRMEGDRGFFSTL